MIRKLAARARGQLLSFCETAKAFVFELRGAGGGPRRPHFLCFLSSAPRDTICRGKKVRDGNATYDNSNAAGGKRPEKASDVSSR